MNIFIIDEKKITQIGELSVVSISLKEIKDNPPLESEIFIVNCENKKYAKAACEAIRRDTNPAIYLKPIILINSNENFTINNIADGYFTIEQTDALNNSFFPASYGSINQRIEEIQGFKGVKDTNIALKVLRYIMTRKMSLTPFRGSGNRFGLYYPNIDIFMRSKDETIYNTLDFLEDQNLLSQEFYEKVHLCIHCNSSFLNFMEVCPHCGSADLEDDDLVHHFDCAHVAPAKNFKQNGSLICPKCDKELKGLGVDYDKPATVFRCNSCRHTSQNPDISTTCFHCSTVTEPEDLQKRKIKKYSITALGENAAIHGIDQMFIQILDEKIKILPYQAFKILLSSEIERIRRYDISKSSVILFQITQSEQFYAQLGKRTRQIFSEIGDILNSVLRTCDITTTINEVTFISLLPETDSTGADVALRRLKEKFSVLIESNFEKQIEINTSSISLNKDQDVESVLTGVIENATAN
ncbi:MAG: hypothetical protein GY714_25260 [Desulfobacterales bacterium]|nr:hypothetical protein [Desulfobacterales bacterium]MCP4164075.1 hypothetical protein [Deltaproteobacteria bacterium]